MQALRFEEANRRYVITILTKGDTLGLWNRFKGRVIDDEQHRTASTYSDYESGSLGNLYLLRYDIANPQNECKVVFTEPAKSWKQLPPVLFETGGKYHFHIEIRGIKGKARIVHPLKEVTDDFDYISTGEEKGLLMGVVDFINQPGTFVLRFEYTASDGTHYEESLSVEVVSPKMDTKHDLQEIKRLIEQEYENYVYQYLSLTYQNQSLQRKSKSEDDVWMSIFQQIVDKYIKAVRYIMEHSNKRSVQRVYYQKPDRIKRWERHELEKMYNRGEDADNYYYRHQITEQTINTRENRFVKHTLLKIEERLAVVFENIKQKYGDSLDDAYKQKMQDYCNVFNTLRHSKFFRSIGAFEGQMQESQVMQQRAGYRNVYVYWQLLKSVVELENGSTQIGMRQIWKLYEVWCYLIMKRLIAKSLGIDDLFQSKRVRMSGSTMAECLEDDKKTCSCKFFFDENEGDADEESYVELIYQCRYEYSDSATEEHSLTIEQIPDIVLNIRRKGQETLTYLYDAKYRVYDDRQKNTDMVTDEPVHDAINAMHRYRDAIYYGTSPDTRIPDHTVNRPDSKEVIGGYILFPGRVGSEERLEEKYYIKSIETINIGAFPVMPTKFEADKPLSECDLIVCNKLEEHIKKVLTEKRALVHIENAVPQRGLKYTANYGQQCYVLVGYIQDKDVKAFETHHIYYIRACKEGKKEIEVVPNYEKAEYVLLHGTKGTERKLYKVEKGAHFLSAKALKGFPKIPYHPNAEDTDMYIGYKVLPEPVVIEGFDIDKVELGAKGKQYEPKVICICCKNPH